MKFIFNRINFILIMSLLVIACGDQQTSNTIHPPEIFSSGDECHVCGMLITKLSGPKGQAFDRRNNKMKKFCSTFDLLSWILQPENRPNIKEIYVHDMTDGNWQHPNDAKLISAKTAFYVLDSNKKGSMGKTIASFSTKKNAQLFVDKWDGEVLNFEQLSIERLLQ